MGLSRREFITYSAVGGSLMVSVPMAVANSAKTNTTRGDEWCLYVEIKADNKIVIESPVQDMGQHMKTTGPLMIAEELDADWELVKCRTSKVHFEIDGERTKYTFATQSTGGSHAVRANWDYMRTAGATTKALLKKAAAAYWNVPVNLLKTQESFVINMRSGEKLSYGSLAKTAATLSVDESDVKLKQRDEYRLFGQDITTVDIDEIITGKPLFGLDMRSKNMLHAVIERAPFYHGKIKSYSDKRTLEVKGVVKTVKIDLELSESSGEKLVSEGIAVVAESLWSAMKGREMLEIEWQQDKFVDESSESLLSDFKSLCETANDKSKLIDNGNIKDAFANAEKIFEREYHTQHLAHLCMEPFNVIADVSKNSARIVVGNQNPKGVAESVADELKIKATQIEVVPTRMGGGFGRRWQTDSVKEAVRIAKHFERPVKVTWTREDEVSQDYFGQAVFAKIKVGTNRQGQITAWHNKQAQIEGSVHEYCFPHGLVANYRIDKYDRKSGTNIGAWRGPGHLQSCFVTESIIDEIAQGLNRDPLEYRMSLYGDNDEIEYKGYGGTSKSAQRMKKCYQKVAEMSDWKRKRPKGVGLGIAGHYTFGSYAAFVVEYDAREKRRCKIVNVWGAIDCGLPLNPNHIRNQMEGGFIDGLNATLFNNVRIKNGAIQNTNFDSLHFMRMFESPQNFEVAIMENNFPPTGVGEPPTAPAAGALANAIFAATGKRQRNLPLQLV